VGKHTCLNCHKAITWRFAICTDCEAIYGNKATDWPDWLRFLWADTQRERRSAKRRDMYEVPADFDMPLVVLDEYEDVWVWT
jgi:hypothetical protein